MSDLTWDLTLFFTGSIAVLFSCNIFIHDLGEVLRGSERSISIGWDGATLPPTRLDSTRTQYVGPQYSIRDFYTKGRRDSRIQYIYMRSSGEVPPIQPWHTMWPLHNCTSLLSRRNGFRVSEGCIYSSSSGIRWVVGTT